MNKEMKEIQETMKVYNFMLGKDKTHFTLLNPSEAIRRTDHHDTAYYYFDCIMISRDSEIIPAGKHTIQLPSKRVVYPLIQKIKIKNKMKKPVNITIQRKNKFYFDIIIHEK